MATATRRCHRRLLTSFLALVALGAAVAAIAETADERPVKTIGIVLDGLPPDDAVLSLARLMDVPRAVREETLALTHREFDVRFPEDKQLQGGWDLSRIHAAIDRLLADPEVDIVLAMGVFATNDVCRRERLAKPVIGPFAVDVTTQSLPIKGDASGVENLNYLIRRGNVREDLEQFRKHFLAYSRLHVLVDSLFVEGIEELDGFVKAQDERLGTITTVVPVSRTADDVLALLDDAEAVYVTPLVRMPAREFDRLVASLIERGLPSFSLQGQVEVERGILAGQRRATDSARMARRVALNIQRILHGEDAGTLPVLLDQPERLMINMATARAIGVYPRWRTTLEADLIHETGPSGHPLDGRSLTLSECVHEALEANLALAARDRAVAAGEQDVRLARSANRPQVDASATGLQIDEDRASAIQPERTLDGTLAASQLLYSEDVRSTIDVAQRLQRSLELDRQTQELDVALDASLAFLDVLRAQTLERIAKDNKTLTESNLELARRREAIGFSGPADVYRWEAELATDYSELIAAHNRVHAAFIVLNRVLHRPLEQLYELHAPSLDDPSLVTGFGRLNPYIDNAAGFELFRDFSVERGLAAAPELASLGELIAAEERRLSAAHRSYWAPDVGLSGALEREFSRDGAGTGIVEPDEDTWSVGVAATLPLFNGGARRARVRQSTEELARLRLEHEALGEGVELRIRTALFDVASSFPAIGLAQEAQQASEQNLGLVTDSYSRGVVSIIDLLDAQNAARVAEEFSANAVYDFLIDLMRLQRATNEFDFFRSDAGRDAWFDQLEAYYAEAGYRSLRPRGAP